MTACRSQIQSSHYTASDDGEEREPRYAKLRTPTLSQQYSQGSNYLSQYESQPKRQSKGEDKARFSETSAEKLVFDMHPVIRTYRDEQDGVADLILTSKRMLNGIHEAKRVRNAD